MTRTRRQQFADEISENITVATQATISDYGNGSEVAAADPPLTNAEGALRDKVHGPSDLKSLIAGAKQQALMNKKPKKAKRVEELYQQSLSDERLTVLLETALRTNATPKEQRELQEYISGVKPKRSISQGSTPRDSTSTGSEIILVGSATSRSGNESGDSINTLHMANLSEHDLLAPFCTSELWPRYCRLPPGPTKLEAMTSTKINNRGQCTPCQSVPEEWLQDAVLQLACLLRVARAERKVLIEKAVTSSSHQGQDPHVLLAEEVLWTTHKGPCKERQKRQKIGLLLECVGIDRKGTFWKG